MVVATCAAQQNQDREHSRCQMHLHASRNNRRGVYVQVDQLCLASSVQANTLSLCVPAKRASPAAALGAAGPAQVVTNDMCGSDTV